MFMHKQCTRWELVRQTGSLHIICALFYAQIFKLFIGRSNAMCYLSESNFTNYLELSLWWAQNC